MTDNNREVPYRLINQDRQDRLKEFAALENPTDLKSEIHTTRMLLEEAIVEGDKGAAIALTNTLAKLSQVSEATKLRRGELLTKASAIALAQKVVGILTQQIAGRFDGWEQALDTTQQEILLVASEMKNEEFPENRF